MSLIITLHYTVNTVIKTKTSTTENKLIETLIVTHHKMFIIIVFWNDMS